MLDTARQMAELKFEAPLAQFEESEEWGIGGIPLDTTEVVDNIKNILNSGSPMKKNINENLKNSKSDIFINSNNVDVDNGPSVKNGKADIIKNLDQGNSVSENFTETFSGSLEDLVNTFDERITKCFCDYEENVEKLAPVQVRTQEEIMNECQMWWTITGNFGNILPIDWSKSYARKLHMPALNLNDAKERGLSSSEEILDLSDEDEQVANDLDMHSLILNGLHQDYEPVKTAEEVIREIDDMIQDDYTPDSEGSLLDDSVAGRCKQALPSPLYEEKLKQLSLSQLNEVYLELEVLIREYSETLISELALRDELEYEKELKNTFIDLLVSVQNRRRQYHAEKKRNGRHGNCPRNNAAVESKYLTTVIPYHKDSGPPDNQALQVLIKILKAIKEDNPTVPTLLTDYILKVLCPT
ncbi:UNVERIFIED_CONTAM: hypothetical protein PYX00_009189 [Menopon gallinae]|uniref:Fasciculation and elongation protein zeta-2 n=1 Tax=Menopon gallinae TaxID=328185 RepID=A0AAW2HAM3_9NEOP